jgi:tRNA G18 (ribose-2'-O)-methylase SpoU
LYHVEGRNPVLEILRHRRVRKVLLAKGIEEGPKISEIIELAREGGSPWSPYPVSDWTGTPGQGAIRELWP